MKLVLLKMASVRMMMNNQSVSKQSVLKQRNVKPYSAHPLNCLYILSIWWWWPWWPPLYWSERIEGARLRSCHFYLGNASGPNVSHSNFAPFCHCIVGATRSVTNGLKKRYILQLKTKDFTRGNCSPRKFSHRRKNLYKTNLSKRQEKAREEEALIKHRSLSFV